MNSHLVVYYDIIPSIFTKKKKRWPVPMGTASLKISKVFFITQFPSGSMISRGELRIVRHSCESFPSWPLVLCTGPGFEAFTTGQYVVKGPKICPILDEIEVYASQFWANCLNLWTIYYPWQDPDILIGCNKNRKGGQTTTLQVSVFRRLLGLPPCVCCLEAEEE